MDKNPTTKRDMRRLHAASEAFEKKSTELSDKLQAACSYIDDLPCKLPVSVGEGDEQLMLRRTQNSWSLCYGSEESHEPVTRGSVTMKAKAAVLLGPLFAKLSTNIASQLSEVEVGLEAIKGTSFPVAIAEGEDALLEGLFN